MAHHPTRGAWFVRVAMICTLLMLSLMPARFATATVDPTTIYVSPSGQDLEDTPTIKYGTSAYPYATLQFAIGKAQTGTTTAIKLKGGTYPIINDITWSYPSGTPSKRISVEPYDTQTPVLDCANTTLVESCLKIGVEYVDIKGLEIKNSRKSGIAVLGGSHVGILNNHVYNSKLQGIYVSGRDGITNHVVINANNVHDNALSFSLPFTADSVPEGWASGIGIQHQSTNVTVTNNLVYHNHGEGIGISSKVGTVVSGNLVHDNFATNIYINGAHDAMVEGNFVYTSDEYMTLPPSREAERTLFFRYNAPANGISVSNENDLDADTLSNLTIRNNIVIGGRYAFYYGGYKLIAGGMKNSIITHNTFYTNKAYADSGNSATVFIGLDKDSNSIPVNRHVNTTFYNNAVMHAATNGAIRTISTSIPSTSIEFKNNGWYTLGSAATFPGTGTGDVTTDPRFVNAGGLGSGGIPRPSPEFYKLTSASPLINKANANGANKDFWGDARVQAAGTDIGADEYAPTVSLTQVSYSVNEGALAVIVVQLSQPMIEPVSVHYATSNGSAIGVAPCTSEICPFPDGDYVITSGVVNFAAGQTLMHFTVPTYGDGIGDDGEYFMVTLSSPTNIGLDSQVTSPVDISESTSGDM
jgi:parallel beta-helix repeat protein